MTTTDLTKRPPRSVRARLGGYALLPRMLDKGRAEIAGTNGEYHFACPLDQRILAFLGLEAEALREELATGKGDHDILLWIRSQQRNQHSETEIAAWSREQDERGADPESAEFFQKYLNDCGSHRTDIRSWADLLDLDDYVSFGGKA